MTTMDAATGTSVFGRWREAFNTLDTCPWPGPRPLGLNDHTLLIGRELDRVEFRKEVDNHRLVFLAGESGVGKSSLLEAGLVPGLVAAGYVVGVCNDWSMTTLETNPAQFLAEKIATAMHRQLPDLEASPTIYDELEEQAGDRCVIILDQFEELIRDAPTFAENTLKLLVQLNHDTNLNLVISLRSEYLYKLETLETKAKPFTLAHYRLKPIDPSFALDVVLSANANADAIEQKVAEQIAAKWQEAREATVSTNDPFGRVGLLHLQALLYALHDKTAGRRVTSADVTSMGTNESEQLFISGLLASIDVKLRRCRAACVDPEVGLDPFLIEGTAQALANTVGHLASAGYKLVREANELAESAMGAEFRSLVNGMSRSGETSTATGAAAASNADNGDGEPTTKQRAALLNVVALSILSAQSTVDLLKADRATIAAAADQLCPATGSEVAWADRLHVGAPPWVADPAEVTCGPMSGLAPAAVLIEELRRFVFALGWMRESSLVRMSTPGTIGTMVSLIHDGFGEALKRWSSRVLKGPSGALAAITAPQGASFGWQTNLNAPPLKELDGGDPFADGTALAPSPKVLANLRWKGGWVRANFRNVAFVNCDLRGLFFDRCAMSAVTFVNCLLDGVIFSDCSFEQASDPASGEWWHEPQEFVVPMAGRELIDGMIRYRELDETGSVLLSPLPGAPAIPMPAGESEAKGWTPLRGGVTIYGGRLSSFVVRNCRFGQGTRFSFRHVAGSGLDVVEHAGGTFEIFGSAMRQLTVTSAVGETSTDFTLHAQDSAIAQVWIGGDVTGRFDANNCMLVHIWNGSNATMTARNCSTSGLVNVEVDPLCKPIDGIEVKIPLERADPDRSISQRSLFMDYRRNPARTSAEQPSPQ